MTDLGSVEWPPAPLRTERLVLRQTETRDRDAYLELRASPEVGRYLGGARPREELERSVGDLSARQVGVFAVEREGSLIGTVHVQRRGSLRPGHVRPGGDEVELAYLFVPHAWGFGYATEACAAVLAWVDDVLPGEPVLLCTQTANDRSLRLARRLGFVEVERFEEFDAEQWLGVRWPPDLKPRGAARGRG